MSGDKCDGGDSEKFTTILLRDMIIVIGCISALSEESVEEESMFTIL